MTAIDADRAEPFHTASPTAHLLDELQLYGHRPFDNDPDPRPLPEPRIATTAIADIFDALIATFADTRLEPDLDPLLWATVNLFHHAIDRVERELDDNEQAQRRSQEAQDGSEIRSVELERLTAQGDTLIERRNAFEFLRDEAAAHYGRRAALSVGVRQDVFAFDLVVEGVEAIAGFSLRFRVQRRLQFLNTVRS